MSVNDGLMGILGVLTALSALGILLFKNIMHAALALLTCMTALAGIYGLTGAEYLAITQLVIYAGGIIALILLAIMLTAPTQDKPLQVTLHNRFAGLALCGGLLLVLVVTYQPEGSGKARSVSLSDVGFELLTNYIFPFEWSGLLLLVCLIGAAYTAGSPQKRIP